MAAKITYTIQKELGDLSIAPNGWKKQLTYTSWNNREEKFDLRSWNEDHTAMTKGMMKPNNMPSRYSVRSGLLGILCI